MVMHTYIYQQIIPTTVVQRHTNDLYVKNYKDESGLHHLFMM